MAIADTIKQIEDALDSGDIKKAESTLLEALKKPELQNSFKITILNAQYLVRRKKYNKAIEETEKALKIAFENGKRAQLAEALNVKAIAYFRSKDFPHAFNYAVRACYFDDQPNSEIKIFKNIVQTKYLKEGGITEAELKKTEQELLSKPPSYDISIINSQDKKQTQSFSSDAMKPSDKQEKSAVSQNLRTDWFDSGKTVELSIYVKKISIDSVVLKIRKDSLNVTFEDSNGNHYEYAIDKLFDVVDGANSSFKVYGTKLAIVLAKLNSKVWKSLEANSNLESETGNILKGDISQSAVYPSSSKKKVEWSKLNFDEEKDDDEDGSPEDFFKKLYDGADPDAKRAMMKSFMESNGTSLSTDWKDVGSRRVDPYVDEKEG